MSGPGDAARNVARLQRRVVCPGLAEGAACHGWPRPSSGVGRRKPCLSVWCRSTCRTSFVTHASRTTARFRSTSRRSFGSTWSAVTSRAASQRLALAHRGRSPLLVLRVRAHRSREAHRRAARGTDAGDRDVRRLADQQLRGARRRGARRLQRARAARPRLRAARRRRARDPGPRARVHAAGPMDAQALLGAVPSVRVDSVPALPPALQHGAGRRAGDLSKEDAAERSSPRPCPCHSMPRASRVVVYDARDLDARLLRISALVSITITRRVRAATNALAASRLRDRCPRARGAARRPR